MNLDTVLDRCLGEKFMGDIPDFEPLVAVMELVADIIGEHRLVENPKARRLWVRAREHLQENEEVLEHNSLIPCRYCDTAFKPVIGLELLDLYLKWSEQRDAKSLLAIHCCPACGGALKATSSKKYEGDGFTPRPGMVVDDETWAALLSQGWGFS